MAEERVKQLVLLLPLILIACDIWTAISIPARRSHSQQQQQQQFLQTPRYVPGKDSTSLGGNFHISYCTSCSMKSAAMQTKGLLESSFPGATVHLSNFPPPLYKQMLSKVVSVAQFGGMGIVMAGDHIFPRLGYSVPPAWFNSMRQNKFGTIATSWLLGNFAQNMLRSTGAFEVYYDGELIFSKLQTNRFPADGELGHRISKVLEARAFS